MECINAVGPEIGVAGTKAYTFPQILLSQYVCSGYGIEDRIFFNQRRFRNYPGSEGFTSMIQEGLEQDAKVLEIAKKLYEKRSC